VRRAIELPLGGLEQEIRWLYYTKGTLAKVLQESRALIEKSKTSADILPEDSDLAIPRLTAGGIIALERTLHKLQDLYDAKPSTATQVP
jgi:ubiquitin-conjugating enzyme E2 O